MWRLTILLQLVLLSQSALAKTKLASYNVDRNSISVSGFSSGATFASQIFVAFSSNFSGVATLAGFPYACQDTSLDETSCMDKLSTSGTIFKLQAKVYEAAGLIDATDNMLDKRVYIWTHAPDCSKDSALTLMYANIGFYVEFTSEMAATCNGGVGHGYPTMDYGIPCEQTRPPFINDCGIDMAYDSLHYMYPDLKRPSNDEFAGELIDFDQKEFLSSSDSFEEEGGYVYVPPTCQQGDLCTLHVVFHGCTMGRAYIGDEFVVNVGLLQVADANNVILLFPQIAKNERTGGCWDTKGYDGEMFATREGVQHKAIMAMIRRITE